MSLLKQIKRFCSTNKGHTKTALKHTLAVIDHMIEHRDWDVTATLISGTDAKMGKQIRNIVSECVGGITMRLDDKHVTGMRFKLGDNFGPTEKLGVLRDLVEAEASLYSEAVNQGLLGKERVEPAQKSLEDVTEHVAKYLAKHGFTLEGVIKVAEVQH